MKKLSLILLLLLSRNLYASAFLETEEPMVLSLANAPKAEAVQVFSRMAVKIRTSTGSCSGTVIGENTVMTAGHCVNNIGDLDEIQIKWENGATRGVDFVSAYNLHGPSSFFDRYQNWDIALLRTKSKVPSWDDGYSYLNGRYATVNSKYGNVGYVYSYGITNDGTDGLHKAWIDDCNPDSQGSGLFYCRGSNPDNNRQLNIYALPGDSGAGVILWVDHEKRFYINGMVVRTNNSAHGTLIIPVDRIYYLVNELNKSGKFDINIM